MINAHPDIVVAPECGFAQWLYGKYCDWDSACCEDEAKLNGFVTDLFASRKFETWRVSRDKVTKNIILYRPKTYSELVSLIYFTYGKKEKNRFFRWGDKNNYYMRHIELLYKVFPSSKPILIVRDGRDVACSYRELARKQITSKYRPHLQVDIEKISMDWSRNNLAAVQSLKKCFGRNYYVVKYEDLVSDSVVCLKNICAYLGEPYSDEMMRYHDKAGVNEPKEFIQWKDRVLQKPVTTQVGRYRKELESKEVAAFEKKANAALRYFNYI